MRQLSSTPLASAELHETFCGQDGENWISKESSGKSEGQAALEPSTTCRTFKGTVADESGGIKAGQRAQGQPDGNAQSAHRFPVGTNRV